VKYNEDNRIIEIVSEYTAMEESAIKKYANMAIRNMDVKGEIAETIYLMRKTNYGKIICFVNTTIQNQMLENLRTITYNAGIISILILLVIVFFLSKFITKPIQIAFEKQKTFVSDVSHELKTPLTIISTNADLLADKIDNDENLTEIKNQSNRMSGIVNELLLLSKNEKLTDEKGLIEFNLSKALYNTVLPLEVVAFEKKKRIDCEIKEDIVLYGNEKSITKMMEALMDNAIKYSYNDTTIKVKLYTKSNRKIIEVYNKCSGVTKEESEKIFDKFYRLDESRARETGGFGLGLSIVKSIVDSHKGKIEVISIKNEDILFRIIF
jgi:signal transduction histidine kinase